MQLLNSENKYIFSFLPAIVDLQEASKSFLSACIFIKFAVQIPIIIFLWLNKAMILLSCATLYSYIVLFSDWLFRKFWKLFRNVKFSLGDCGRQKGVRSVIEEGVFSPKNLTFERLQKLHIIKMFNGCFLDLC